MATVKNGTKIYYWWVISMDNNAFSYTYSAKDNAEIKRIRNKYISHESDLNILRKLDQTVQRSGQIQGLSIGIVGSLVFGIGMCFGLGVFSQNIVLAKDIRKAPKTMFGCLI
jgi:hypothetical protein